jgi:hypothetical protein
MSQRRVPHSLHKCSSRTENNGSAGYERADTGLRVGSLRGHAVLGQVVTGERR